MSKDQKSPPPKPSGSHEIKKSIPAQDHKVRDHGTIRDTAPPPPPPKKGR